MTENAAMGNWKGIRTDGRKGSLQVTLDNNIQVLTTDQIVGHMVDTIKEVNSVVEIPTTTVR